MQLHLLLTPDVAVKKPTTTKIIHDYGQLTVVFNNDIGDTRTGLHCVVEDTKENIIDWLKEFDGFAKGNGVPMMESFEIVHIKENINLKN